MVDIKNKNPEFDIFAIEAGENFNTSLGGTRGELRDVIGGKVNINNRDNDLVDLLSELLLGKTDGTGDDETSDGVAGIDGVELVSLDANSFTIAVTNDRGVTDYATFAGAGVTEAINTVAAMSDAVDIADQTSAFTVVEVNTDIPDGVSIGPTVGELNEVIGDLIKVFDRDDDIDDLVAELTTGSFNANLGVDSDSLAGIVGVELLDIDDDSFVIQIANEDGELDTVLFTGTVVEAAVANNATRVDIKNSSSQLGVIDATGDVSTSIGGTAGELNNVIGGLFNVNNRNDDFVNIIDELVFGTGGGDGEPGITNVNIIGLDEDGLTIEVNQRSDAPDIIIIDGLFDPSNTSDTTQQTQLQDNEDNMSKELNLALDTNGGANRFFTQDDTIKVSGQGVGGRPEIAGDVAKLVELWDGTIKSTGSINDDNGGEAGISAQANGIAKISGDGVGGQYRFQFDSQEDAQDFVDFLEQVQDAHLLKTLLEGAPEIEPDLNLRVDTNGGGNRFFLKDDDLKVSGQGVGGQPVVSGDLDLLAEIWGGDLKRAGNVGDGDLDGAFIRANDNGVATIGGSGVGGSFKFKFDDRADAERFVDFLEDVQDAGFLGELLVDNDSFIV